MTEILREIWLLSANKTKSSEAFSKQPSQLIVELNSLLRHIIVRYEQVDGSDSILLQSLLPC